MGYKTDQENFWAGEFGNDYIGCNQGDNLLASNLNFFSKALKNASNINRVIEFGANIGMNLKALKLLYPKIDLHAIEINSQASVELRKIIPLKNVYESSIIDWDPCPQLWDLVFIKGVLIHINPNELEGLYRTLVRSTDKYLLVAEYYNPTPVVLDYRGNQNRLFKRDFAGEIMDLFPEMKLLDYGFAYHRDLVFPQDDITWFLMEKH